MKAINELSADELRREIAERLGYTWKQSPKTPRGNDLFGIFPNRDTFTLMHQTIECGNVLANSIEEAWSEVFDDGLIEYGEEFPNWPRDAGAALALCMTLCPPNWSITIGNAHPYGVIVSLVNPLAKPSPFTRPELSEQSRKGCAEARWTADALARLALAALRAQDE